MGGLARMTQVYYSFSEEKQIVYDIDSNNLFVPCTISKTVLVYGDTYIDTYTDIDIRCFGKALIVLGNVQVAERCKKRRKICDEICVAIQPGV